MKKLIYIILTFALFIPAFAAPDSLKGIDTAKFIVDLNQPDAKKLRLRLQLILETMDTIESDGVKTDVVVAVRGGASRFMLTTNEMVDHDEEKIKADILALTEKLEKRGVTLEQCAVALRLSMIDPHEVHPRFKVVPNGYVSIIGYQNRGYALLPME